MKKILDIGALLFLCSLFCAGKAQAQSICEDIPIDDFASSSGTNFQVSANDPLLEVVDDGGGGVIGSFRTITFELLQGTGLDFALLLVGSGNLSLAHAGGAISRFSLLYDADGGGLGLDLSARELIRKTVLVQDLGLTLTYILTDENLNQASFTQTLPTVITDEIELQSLFADFTNIQNIDLAAIDSVEIIYEADTVFVDALFESFDFSCRGAPESVAVPTMSGFAYIVLIVCLLLLGAFGLRRAGIY